MALSNIFREPRREITETLVGILVAGIFLAVDWQLNRLIPWRNQGAFIVGMVFGIILVPAISIGIPVLIHFLGEEVCEKLDGWGLRLRPKERYRQ